VDKIKVPRKVWKAIEAVKESGKTNMLDWQAVQFYCNENEEYEAVVWIQDHYKEWGQLIMLGPEIIEGENDAKKRTSTN